MGLAMDSAASEKRGLVKIGHWLFVTVAVYSTFCWIGTFGALAQQPSRVNCFKWDTDFLTVFNQAVWLNVLFSFLFGFLAFGLLARPLAGRFWFFTRPHLRILALALVVFIIFSLLYITGPLALWGLGLFPYGGVPATYLGCDEVSTEYLGIPILTAIIGQGVPALAQANILYLILGAGTLIGGGFAWLASILKSSWAWRSTR